MNVGELFIALGFDVDDGKLKEFNENIKTGYTSLLKISAISVGALYALDRFVEGSIRGAVALRNFNIQTGDSTDELQKWQIAATLSNTAMSVDQVTASIQALRKMLTDVTLGKGGGPLGLLGINARDKTPFQILEELREILKAKSAMGWNRQQKISFMQDAGVDPGLLNALDLTKDRFDELANKPILSKQSIDRLNELGGAIASIKMDFSIWKDQMSADMAPGLINFLNTAAPLAKDFAASVSSVFGKLKEFWDWLAPVQPQLLGWAAALFIAFNPVTAIFTALGVAIWDIGRAIRGLPSFTGGAWDQIVKLMTDPTLYNLMNKWEDSAAKRLNPQAKPWPIESRSLSVPAGLTSPQNAFNNIYNITGIEDAFTLADEINSHQQRQYNFTLADQNNGPRY